MQVILDYALKILPGLVLTLMFLLLLPKRSLQFRIFAYILLFILIRDSMTALKLTSYGKTGIFWIRYIDNGTILIVLAILYAIMVYTLYRYEKELRKLIVWSNGNTFKDLYIGLLGAFFIIMPLISLYLNIPMELRGGDVRPIVILPCLLLVMLGNLFEELVFSGYFQGYFEKIIDPERAFLLSGVLFSVCHLYLATTVTNIGAPLIGFTLYEGLVVAFVRMKVGVLGAVVSHGLAIFILASGLL